MYTIVRWYLYQVPFEGWGTVGICGIRSIRERPFWGLESRGQNRRFLISYYGVHDRTTFPIPETGSPTPPPGLSPPHPGSQRRQPEDHRGSQAHTRVHVSAARTVPPIGMDSFEDTGLRNRKGIPGPPGIDRPGKRREKGLRGLSPVAGDLRPQGRSFPARGRGGRSSCSRGRRR